MTSLVFRSASVEVLSFPRVALYLVPHFIFEKHEKGQFTDMRNGYVTLTLQ